LPVHSAASSRDGTIVALAHGPVVSLWDTESNTLLKTLDADSIDVNELLFVGDEGRYLIGAGKGLTSWDLFSCEAVWTVNTPHAHLSAHPSGFTALSTVSDISILSLFSASSAKPISEHRINAQSFRSVLRLPSHTHTSATSASAPGKSGLSFVGVTTQGEVVKFGEASTPAPRLKASLADKQFGAEAEGKRGIWQEMFGDRAFALHNADVSASGAGAGEGRVGKVERKIQGRASAVFDGPSHTLPPVATLFDAFIDEVLALPIVGQREAARDASAGALGNGTIDVDYTDDDEGQQDGAETSTSQSVVGTGFMPTHGRKKDEDVDMREMESFFRQILLSPKTTAQASGKGKNKDKSKTKGKGKEHANASGQVDEAPTEQGSAAAEAPSKPNRKERRQARPSLQADGAMGDEDEDDDAGREVEVPDGGASKVKAKKRKAPRESAGVQ
jgi:NET1-associated nuclear protein 1 (U3 small nucleolar RNA-associated protein 17)